MLILVMGFGSIGQRHTANLRKLRPDANLVFYDPPKGHFSTSGFFDAAIIASPTDKHAEHIEFMAARNIPFYVEKPLGSLDVTDWDKCAVGFQYRFHPAIPQLRARVEMENVLGFFARDNLVGRYGRDVAGIMASHAIDLALWLLGPALRVELHSDGVALGGFIQHERGASTYDYRMDADSRQSYVTTRGRALELPPDEGMYLECLKAWLEWVQGGSRDERTATLADGLAVERVLRSVRVAA